MTRSSSWIQSILYRNGFLAVFIAEDHQPTSQIGRVPVAMLYSDIPAWLPGLLIAGTGRRSIGLAYNRLVKNQYLYQRIEGQEKVEELRGLMSGEIQMKEVA